MTSPRVRRVLLGGAIGLGMLAPLASRERPGGVGDIDVRSLAAAVQREEDHVTALQLAEWIKDRKPGLRVIDVRTVTEFDQYHIPSAEQASLERLTAGLLPRSATLVLYSAEGAHAAQAWVFLRALGYEQVYFLRGGLTDWVDDVINPTLASDAPAADRAAFQRTAAISRYFGGVPRIAPADGSNEPPPPQVPAAGRVASVRRRGC